jgi:hypothetical protein
MRYDRAAVGAVLVVPKLIGSYEHELHPVVEEIRGRPYTRILDLGCAEGYYAVGLARLFSGCPILAVDIDGNARRLCRRTTQINSASGVTVSPGLGRREIIDYVTGVRSLVVCDVEGAEEDLLLPPCKRGFASCDLLVELHDFARPGVSKRILDGFAGTHEISVIEPDRADPEGYADLLDSLPRDLWPAALDETRPEGVKWMWAKAQ